MNRVLQVAAFALVALAFSAPAAAAPHGGDHGSAPTTQPAGGNPGGAQPGQVDYGDAHRRQQANRGGGGGCAGCAVDGETGAAPALALLAAFALIARRRR